MRPSRQSHTKSSRWLLQTLGSHRCPVHRLKVALHSESMSPRPLEAAQRSNSRLLSHLWYRRPEGSGVSVYGLPICSYKSLRYLVCDRHGMQVSRHRSAFSCFDKPNKPWQLSESARVANCANVEKWVSDGTSIATAKMAIAGSLQLIPEDS
jgi:hypothetical protein